MQNLFLKKTIAISFLVIMLLGQCGYYCFYAFQIFLAKESAKEQLLQQLPDHLLNKIAVSENYNAIQWEEEGKEFSLNGEMYDVVRTLNENGKQYLLCFNDTKEGRLVEALVKVVKVHTDGSPNSGKHHVAGKSLIADWVLSLSAEDTAIANGAITAPVYFEYTPALPYSVIKNSSPPPNLYLKLNKQT